MLRWEGRRNRDFSDNRKNRLFRPYGQEAVNCRQDFCIMRSVIYDFMAAIKVQLNHFYLRHGLKIVANDRKRIRAWIKNELGYDLKIDWGMTRDGWRWPGKWLENWLGVQIDAYIRIYIENALWAPRKIRIFHRVQLDPKKDPLQTNESCRASDETYRW